jgi:hypothetical protein
VNPLSASTRYVHDEIGKPTRSKNRLTKLALTPLKGGNVEKITKQMFKMVVYQLEIIICFAECATKTLYHVNVSQYRVTDSLNI